MNRIKLGLADSTTIRVRLSLRLRVKVMIKIWVTLGELSKFNTDQVKTSKV